MALPADVNTITVTGAWMDFQATPCAGSVLFQGVRTQDPAHNTILVAKPITVSLDGAGHITVSLVATNDPYLSPTGWTYAVTENITGVPALTYNIIIDQNAAGGTVDLADLAPAVAVPATTSFISAQAAAATFEPLLTDVGTWAATTGYLVGQIYTDPNGLRRVTRTSYTSGGSFGSTDTAATIVVGSATVGGGGGGAVSSVAGRTGAVTLAVADVSGAAPSASPSLTGTPTVPTAAAATSTTQAASTAFVTTAVAALVNLAPGTDFRVVYDGTNWKYAGTTVTSRPTARTDLTMLCVNPVDATTPAWAITGDELLRVA